MEFLRMLLLMFQNIQANICILNRLSIKGLTLNACKLPWVVWMTELGLLTNMTFPLLNIGWILAAVCITDCWVGCITLWTLKKVHVNNNNNTFSSWYKLICDYKKIYVINHSILSNSTPNLAIFCFQKD